MKRSNAMLLLLLAAFFWGMAFIAQKSAMDHMGPLTFIGPRYLLGGILVLPFALKEYKRVNIKLSKSDLWILTALCISFFLGSWLQQWGLITTSITNGGFITGTYVFFVPLIQLFIFRTNPHPITWACAPLAVLGLYLLSGANVNPFGIGDYLVLSSAFFWGMQVALLGYLAAKTGLPLFISTICFLSAGLIAMAGAFTMETVTLAALQVGWVEIVYAGIFSTAIGFSLQAVGQQHVPPANAGIIVSSESLFAAAGGAIVFGERLSPVGYWGIGILFIAIVAVESIPAFLKTREHKTA